MHTSFLFQMPRHLGRALWVAVLGGASMAHAGGVYVSVDVGMPGAVLRAVSAPYVVREPVYVQAPRPVVYQPAPVVYAPAPVVYEAPRYVVPPVVYAPAWPERHHHHGRPEGWGAPVAWWGHAPAWDRGGDRDWDRGQSRHFDERRGFEPRDMPAPHRGDDHRPPSQDPNRVVRVERFH